MQTIKLNLGNDITFLTIARKNVVVILVLNHSLISSQPGNGTIHENDRRLTASILGLMQKKNCRASLSISVEL